MYLTSLLFSLSSRHPYLRPVPPVLEHISGSQLRRTMLARNGGSQVMLVANVIKARPAIVANQVLWRDPNNVLIQQSAKYITTVRSSQVNLTLTSLSMGDSGVYTVTIAHEAGTVSLEFDLIVLGEETTTKIIVYIQYIFNLKTKCDVHCTCGNG